MPESRRGRGLFNLSQRTSLQVSTLAPKVAERVRVPPECSNYGAQGTTVVGSNDLHRFVLTHTRTAQPTRETVDDSTVQLQRQTRRERVRPRSAPAVGRRRSEGEFSLRTLLLRQQKRTQPIAQVQQKQERLAAELLRKQRAANVRKKSRLSTQQETVHHVGRHVPALRKYCRNYDQTHSGLITWPEFRSALSRVGVGLHDDQVHELAKPHIQQNYIDFESVLNDLQDRWVPTAVRSSSDHRHMQRQQDDRLLAMVAHSLAAPNHNARRILQHVDRDGDGHVSHTEFKEAMRMLGTPISDRDAYICLQKMDIDGDGRVSVDELQQFVQRARRERRQEADEQRKVLMEHPRYTPSYASRDFLVRDDSDVASVRSTQNKDIVRERIIKERLAQTMPAFLERRQQPTRRHPPSKCMFALTSDADQELGPETPGGIFHLKISTLGASPTYRTTFFDDGPRGDRYSPHRRQLSESRRSSIAQLLTHDAQTYPSYSPRSVATPGTSNLAHDGAIVPRQPLTTRVSMKKHHPHVTDRRPAPFAVDD